MGGTAPKMTLATESNVRVIRSVAEALVRMRDQRGRAFGDSTGAIYRYIFVVFVSTMIDEACRYPWKMKRGGICLHRDRHLTGNAARAFSSSIRSMMASAGVKGGLGRYFQLHALDAVVQATDACFFFHESRAQTFPRPAWSRHVLRTMENNLSEAAVTKLAFLLWTLSTPLGALLCAWPWTGLLPRSFPAMGVLQRRRALEIWSRSLIPDLRAAFKALKATILSSFYARVGGS